jgi:ribosomal protein S18 acetylase RimI-like enzyme
MGGDVLRPNVTIRPVQSSDESFLRRVYASSRAEELAQTGWSEEEKQSFLQLQFTAQWQDYSNRFPDAEQSIVLYEGNPTGRIWVNRSNEEIRLLDITLLPEFRNSGIGAVLLQRLQDEARALVIPLRHAVYKDNLIAIHFYQNLGFTIIEDLATYYIMEWTSSNTD